MFSLLGKIFGTKNDRQIKKIQVFVEQINALEEKISLLSDDDLQAQTPKFKNRLAEGETLDDILPEAFATVREGSRRILGMRHFDCQMVGGYVLHSGNIAEMKTGEGKTLVATLPAYLNALTGKGVHVITVNDYLAKRDAEWMGKLYNFLGLSVGIIVHGITEEERLDAYKSDITYGTNNEFGFDYLRDNMKFDKEGLVQQELNYAIVDEVDSILVDEARTPLIISGPAEKSNSLYTRVNTIIPFLKNEIDYSVDEKAKSSVLTEEGIVKVEEKLQVNNIYDPSNIELLHHVNQALKAHTLFTKDIDYIVKNNKVIIVDEFTGRLMDGRRFSEGLHQALEAKENVKIENENQTLATITFQNYFRMYNKLSGMTGTAETEAEEFEKIYGLSVLIIPTNKPMIRKDQADLIYKTAKEKFDAVIQEIIRLNKKGQPVLVGTISIDESEKLSEILSKRKIKHEVLNAKHHSAEAEIVANAGQKDSVTISTNMAGRGTDIVLGEGVRELGGLYILGTERHESRRIDNQLRGRSGRQGDPGESRYFLSLEDNLLRIFGGEKITKVMDRLGMEDGEPIEHSFISKAIENAQKKVEGHNFDIRKHLLEYDDVMNQQREVIYQLRYDALDGEYIQAFIDNMINDKCLDIAEEFSINKKSVDEWDIDGIKQQMLNLFNIEFNFSLLKDKVTDKDSFHKSILSMVTEIYKNKKHLAGSEHFGQFERFIVLQTVDNMWKDHLLSMDHLKEGIGLRGYAQQDPLIVYKKEAFEMFQDMIERIKEEVVSIIYRVSIVQKEEMDEMQHRETQDLSFNHGDSEEQPKKPVKRNSEKVGRNDLCPCGSGKKYKKCCLPKE